MKNLKNLIKPGYFVKIECFDGTVYDSIVVDTKCGICLYMLDGEVSCISLNDFNYNLEYCGIYKDIYSHICDVFQLSDSNPHSELYIDLTSIWEKPKMLKISLNEIAEKFNTHPENIIITDYGN